LLKIISILPILLFRANTNSSWFEKIKLLLLIIFSKIDVWISQSAKLVKLIECAQLFTFLKNKNIN